MLSYPKSFGVSPLFFISPFVPSVLVRDLFFHLLLVQPEATRRRAKLPVPVVNFNDRIKFASFPIVDGGTTVRIILVGKVASSSAACCVATLIV